ncbi:MAG: hypothetical protein V2A54_16430 [Bacteroidota bacterium]
METALIASLSSLFGVIVGGLISFFLQKQKLNHEFRLKLQENKTENMAEATAKYYLKDEGFYERSFDHIKRKLGGFDDTEIRRILVRAGAVRFIRKEDGVEFWCLVERLHEKYKRDKEKNEKKKHS